MVLTDDLLSTSNTDSEIIDPKQEDKCCVCE